MLMIRLQRVGRKHDPSYRIVVTEKARSTQTGQYLEMLGSYDARKDTKTIDAERVRHWMSNGAQLSDTVHNLFVSAGVIKGKKINVLPKNKNRKAPEPVVEAAPEKAETPAPAESAETPAPVEETPAIEENAAPVEEVPVPTETPAS